MYSQERGTGRTTILRPGEQYPSEEPGVLRNRAAASVVQQVQVGKQNHCVQAHQDSIYGFITIVKDCLIQNLS